MLPGQIMTERGIDEVIEDIDKRNKELHSAKEKLVKSYNQTSQMLEQISKVFREMQLREEQKKKSTDTSIE
jgi:prefoldin subunit 5